MIIAVDFDGTLCKHVFPEIGERNEEVISYIKERKSEGDTIILWTCREDLPPRAYLTEAVQWCDANDIPIDYVNENAPGTTPGGFARRKINARLYIDDKSWNPFLERL